MFKGRVLSEEEIQDIEGEWFPDYSQSMSIPNLIATIRSLQSELQRMSGIINNIANIVNNIEDNDLGWLNKAEEIHYLLLEAAQSRKS